MNYAESVIVRVLELADISDAGGRTTEVGMIAPGLSASPLILATQSVNIIDIGSVFSPDDRFTITPTPREQKNVIPD